MVKLNKRSVDWRYDCVNKGGVEYIDCFDLFDLVYVV